MPNTYTKGIPWLRFMDFITPKADRFSILKEILEAAGLDYSVLSISGNRHFLVGLQEDKDYLRRRPIMLVAHYDRAEGSPGANDNSAGVFLLLETAMKLKKDGVKDWNVVFTDKEEIKSGESIQTQGAYSLGESLKKTEMKNAGIFCFDACGTGDTLIISTTVDYLRNKDGTREKLRESIGELRTLALDTARDLRMDKVLLAPTPFSDDAGFFRAGLAAQTITMLPTEECIRLVTELRRDHQFAIQLISAELKQDSRTLSFPETWRSLNSPSDSHLRLTPQYFRSVVRFAEALCRG